MASYTETEAAEKWCPFAITANFGAGIGGYNRMNYAPTEESGETRTTTRCMGSKCMLWNWQDTAYRLTNDGTKQLLDGKLPNAAATEPNPHRRGFCGLARSI